MVDFVIDSIERYKASKIHILYSQQAFIFPHITSAPQLSKTAQVRTKQLLIFPFLIVNESSKRSLKFELPYKLENSSVVHVESKQTTHFELGTIYLQVSYDWKMNVLINELLFAHRNCQVADRLLHKLDC